MDRIRARAQATSVANAMGAVSFAEVRVDLPSIALALMQNLPKEEQELFGQQLAVLENSSLSDHGKKLALATLVGEDVLIAAIRSLDVEIAPAVTGAQAPRAATPEGDRSVVDELEGRVFPVERSR